MNIKLTSTNLIQRVKGIETRLWEGETEGGTRVFAFIAVISHASDATPAEEEAFKKELNLLHEQPSQKALGAALSLRNIM